MLTRSHFYTVIVGQEVRVLPLNFDRTIVEIEATVAHLAECLLAIILRSRTGRVEVYPQAWAAPPLIDGTGRDKEVSQT